MKISRLAAEEPLALCCCCCCYAAAGRLVVWRVRIAVRHWLHTAPGGNVVNETLKKTDDDNDYADDEAFVVMCSVVLNNQPPGAHYTQLGTY